ncbi:RNA polymerase sigma factor [Terriglobus roseus]|uniref:RNA polymerase sigma factor n=1 Tax=Terriglobus roseus TaxID=392734 RepID=UPI003CCA8E99
MALLSLTAGSTLQLADATRRRTARSRRGHPDVALVDAARHGDTAAFEKLVRQYDRQIFRVAQHITQNREDAEDITQDVFMKAYGKLDQFQGQQQVLHLAHPHRGQ